MCNSTALVFRLGILVLLSACSGSGVAGGATPRTPCEAGGGNTTPTYAETVTWCRDLAASSPLLTFTTFGQSGQGRDLPLVIADARGRHDPAAVRENPDQVVLLVEACIHAGESCGKDAGLMLLRDLATDPDLADRLLDKVTLLFIPIFNVDGHERFGPYNRINQNGPQEMGWRVTAQNLNLNRDFLKADTPEMRAWLGLWNRWQPDFFIDIHSTDGADYQYPITYSLETQGNMDADLTGWVRDYEQGMLADMTDDGIPMAPYVSFVDWHDPRSGLKVWAASPRFSQGYTAIRNRPGLLVETHMLKPYTVRVESTQHLWRHTMVWLNREAAVLRKLVLAADARTASPEFRSTPFALDFERTKTSVPFAFQGIAYEKVTSPVTGGDWFRFGDTPETMQVEFFNEMAPSVQVDLPEAYLIPPQWTAVIDRLDLHGIKYARLPAPAELEIRTWRFRDAKWQERPYEGRHPVKFAAEPLTETVLFPAGTVIVDMNQPAARVAAHLLEPQGPDSLVGWGFFDSIFERVEYVESYVIEDMIQEMITENPALLAELETKKAEDPEFAANPWAIRNWFYKKTPYYDQRVAIYPIGTLTTKKQLEDLTRR